MEKTISKLTENLNETFKERLSSVFLYGSCAVEDCSKDSDINMMVIIENLTAGDLKKSHDFVKTFTKKSKSLPIFMDKDEWFNSADVYPIEYSDIKERYKILCGENLIDGLNVEKKDLRLQCETEVKNLLVRLRQNYLAKSSNSFLDKIAIQKLIHSSSKTFMVIFRTVLKLSDEAVPKNHSDVVRFFWEKFKVQGIDFDGELFLKILEYRKNQKAIKTSEFEEVIQKLIESTNCVLKYVDKLEI